MPCDGKVYRIRGPLAKLCLFWRRPLRRSGKFRKRRSKVSKRKKQIREEEGG